MKPYLLAVASGLLYALANEHGALWPLSFVALVPLLCALQLYARSSRHAFKIGALGGTALNAFAYRWLLPTIHTYAGLPFAAAALAWGLLMIWQSGQLALWCGLIARARIGGWTLAWAAPLGFGAIEQLYPMLFPSPFAASLHAFPQLLQSLELWGATPLSMLLVLVNVRVAELGCSAIARSSVATHARVLGYALLAWVLLALHGFQRSEQVRADAAAAPSLRVGVVQANLGTHEKRRDREGALRKHVTASRALLARGPLDLLIWPETALPGVFLANMPELLLPLGLHVPLLTGAVTYESAGPRTALHNSAFLFDAEQRVIARSDKIRLVPFAERLPLGDRFPVLYDLVPGAGQFTPGTRPVALQLNGHDLVALICYEDILPDLVRAVMRDAAPQLLINITNDAWFGDTAAPHYHFALSVLRTIEHRRYLVRATNSGVSAVVDPTGAVLRATPTFQPASFTAQVALLGTSTLYSRTGDLTGWAIVLAGAVVLLRKRRAPQLMSP